MSWFDWIPSIIEGIGLVAGKDDASRPSEVEPLDLEALARLMTINTRSPWGGMTYTQGPDGRYTAEYELGETQPIFDNAIQRSLSPDQAYQMPGQLSELHQALMQQRLGAAGAPSGGPTARPERRPYMPSGGGRFSGPFADAGDDADQADSPADYVGARGRTGEGRGGGYARDPFNRGPISGGNGGGFSFNDYLNRVIPGAQQGTQLPGWQEWALDNAQNIGRGLSAATGVPLLGALGDAFNQSWYMNNALQNPADLSDHQSGNDLINEAIDGLSSRTGEGGGGRGGGRGMSQIGRTWGAWQKDITPGGDLRWFFRPGGH